MSAMRFRTFVWPNDPESLRIRFLRKTEVTARVKQGELLAQIMDPYLGTVIEDVVSPVDGIVFFHASQPIIYSHTSLFRIIPT